MYEDDEEGFRPHRVVAKPLFQKGRYSCGVKFNRRILVRDSTCKSERLICAECAKAGGQFLVLQCTHGGAFAVHAAQKCVRPSRKMGAGLLYVEQREIEYWMETDEPAPGCTDCLIVQTMMAEPTIEKETRIIMADPMQTKETTFWTTISAKMKTEGGAAAMRAGTRQFLKTSKVPMLGILKRRGVKTANVEKWLETPLGEGLFGIGLGLVLPHVPGWDRRALTKALAEELRVQGMALIASEVADVLFDPLREALLEAFGDVEERRD